MQVLSLFGWVVYISKNAKEIDKHKCGKWMYFFGDKDFAAKICQEAVETGVVSEAKHSDDSTGVCCFYLDGDDIFAHKKVIQFFLDHDLIRRTKKGKLYNISFKFDDQTRAGEYGDGFHSEIKLDSFLELESGEWKI
jgi:hypothetical protein